MIRAETVIAKGDWTGTPADTVVLDYDDRHRRRIAMEGVGGLGFLLDLPEAIALRSGDAIRLDDGRLVEVVGAPEPLVEIRAEGADHLLRLHGISATGISRCRSPMAGCAFAGTM